jgi:hypothetical protein
LLLEHLLDKIAWSIFWSFQLNPVSFLIMMYFRRLKIYLVAGVPIFTGFTIADEAPVLAGVSDIADIPAHADLPPCC